MTHPADKAIADYIATRDAHPYHVERRNDAARYAASDRLGEIAKRKAWLASLPQPTPGQTAEIMADKFAAVAAACREESAREAANERHRAETGLDA